MAHGPGADGAVVAKAFEEEGSASRTPPPELRMAEARGIQGRVSEAEVWEGEGCGAGIAEGAKRRLSAIGEGTRGSEAWGRGLGGRWLAGEIEGALK